MKVDAKLSGVSKDFALSMKEIHDTVKHTLEHNTIKIKKRFDAKKRDVKFSMGDYVMVHLNKNRLSKGKSHKLQMRKVRPCKILAKYGANAYQVELIENMGLSTTFNVEYLVA